MTINPAEIVTALELTKPMAGSLSDAWQAVIGDRIAAWRLQNAAKIQVKVQSELSRLGLSLNPARIPERYAFSWFEEATKHDETEIQALFARLLAKAAAGDEDSADRRHLEIVSRFTPSDAKVMEFFFESKDAQRIHSKDDERLVDIEIDEWTLHNALRDAFDDRARRSVEHLISIGVLEKRITIDSDSIFNALCNLRTDRASGDVFPTWGAGYELEIKPFVASTATGLSLNKALSP